MEKKARMLSLHESQRHWLDSSQGMDEYVATMERTARQVGALSGKFTCAEGWRLHNHLGFSRTTIDPLRALFA